jgi:hypothetical protein
VQLENINNYVLDSNNDAIKDDEGRRYYIADLSHRYQGNLQFFKELRAKCFNDAVGSAFYSYMMEYDLEGFIPQNYPMTKSKLNSISKRLDSVYQFLRDEYILNKKALLKKPKDLFEEYKAYCANKKLFKQHDLIDFKTKFSQINVEPVVATKARTPHYRMSLEELMAVADRKKWIHENDLEDCDADEIKHVTIPEIDYQALLQRIKDLEEQLEKKDLPIDIDSVLDSMIETIYHDAIDEISDEFELGEEEEEEDDDDDSEEEDDEEIDVVVVVGGDESDSDDGEDYFAAQVNELCGQEFEVVNIVKQKLQNQENKIVNNVKNKPKIVCEIDF